MKVSSSFKKITRVAVFMVLLYAIFQAYLFRIGPDIYQFFADSMQQQQQTAFDNMQERQWEVQQSHVNNKNKWDKLKQLDAKTKKDLDLDIAKITRQYDEFLSNDEDINKLLDTDLSMLSIRRHPGESPRDFQRRRDGKINQLSMSKPRYISAIRSYAKSVREIDIESLKYIQQMNMFFVCKEAEVKVCESKSNIFGDSCEKSAKKSCSQYRPDRRMNYNSRARSYSNEKIVAGAEAVIDLLGDINKVDYASDGYSHLMRAALVDDVEKIDKLVNLDANVDLKTLEKGETALMLAAFRKNPASIAALIKSGANVNIKNSKGKTALFYTTNDYEIFNLLIENGADVESRNKQGKTLIFDVLTSILYNEDWMQFKGALEYLLANDANLEAKDNRGSTPLHHAVNIANLEITKLMLDAGANRNAVDDDGNTALHFVAKNRIKSSFSDKLDSSVNSNHAYVMTEFLIKQGINPDIQNNLGATPLMMANLNGNYQVANALIDNNADINLIQNISGSHRTALYKSNGEAKFEEIALTIINHPSFNVNLKPHQEALAYFLQKGMTRAADALIEKGVDINTPEYAQRTPLMNAVLKDDTQYVRKLLDLGADKTLTDSNGATALRLAKKGGHRSIVTLLE